MTCRDLIYLSFEINFAEYPLIKQSCTFLLVQERYQRTPKLFSFLRNRKNLDQKRKNIHSVHDIYNKTIDSNPVLEISSKSEDEIGVQLSAFNLCKYVPSLKKSISVECIYQAAKIFEHGGPFEYLLLLDSKTAKKDERLKNNGKVIGFRYEGKEFPAVPVWAFYNYIYMLALKENEKISKHLLSFSAFSDIEFSIDSFNCQACAAAQYVSLYNQNKLEKALLDFETFLKTCALEAYNYEEV